MVDALVLGTSGAIHGGSSPLLGTRTEFPLAKATADERAFGALICCYNFGRSPTISEQVEGEKHTMIQSISYTLRISQLFVPIHQLHLKYARVHKSILAQIKVITKGI